MSLDEITAFWTLAVIALTALVFFVHSWSAPKPYCAGEVTAIYIYPLKSARGVSVQSATLDERGLEFDRLWMVVDDYGTFLSQRRAPKLALVEVALPASHDDPLQLCTPGKQPLSVPVVREGSDAPTTSVRCWDDQCDAVDQGDEAAAWLASFLGVKGARLVRMTESHRRFSDGKYARAGATTSFSDGFPLLLANDASLAELCSRLVKRGKAPVPMNRFRPNVVVGGEGGAPPFAEDSWAAVALGLRGDLQDGCGARFGVVKPCARCKMPTINQTTGVPDGRKDACAAARGSADDGDEGGGPASEAEPTATLRTFRTGKLLGYKKPGWRADVFFGQNIVPFVDAVGAELSVGDVVMAKPRRPRGLWSRGVRGVHYIG